LSTLAWTPVTGKDLYLRESTRDEKKVPEIRSRLLAKVDQQRTAATNATLAYTVDAWLSVHEVDEATTWRSWRGTSSGYLGGTCSTPQLEASGSA
jgi:hypothetical protein